MYEPPIEILTSPTMYELVAKEAADHIESITMQAIQSVGVNVNKDELIRALNNERAQYEKGEREAYKNLLENAPSVRDPNGVCYKCKDPEGGQALVMYCYGSETPITDDQARILLGAYTMMVQQNRVTKRESWGK